MATRFEGLNCVLLVDDEPMILSVGRRILTRFGIEVLQAQNGETAIELYRADAEKIDLVILDMAMPVMDGAACFSALQQIDPAVRVVLSSGNMEDKEIASLIAAGVLGVLPKPYNMHQLTAVFEQIFAGESKDKKQ